jgi:hypothetical protein
VAVQAEAAGKTVEETRAVLWLFLKSRIYGPRGTPKGNDGMELFTDIDAKSLDYQQEFSEIHS